MGTNSGNTSASLDMFVFSVSSAIPVSSSSNLVAITFNLTVFLVLRGFGTFVLSATAPGDTFLVLRGLRTLGLPSASSATFLVFAGLAATDFGLSAITCDFGLLADAAATASPADLLGNAFLVVRGLRTLGFPSASSATFLVFTDFTGLLAALGDLFLGSFTADIFSGSLCAGQIGTIQSFLSTLHVHQFLDPTSLLSVQLGEHPVAHSPPGTVSHDL